MTEKQKYYRLQSHVCERLPTKSIDALLARGYPQSATALIQVRSGRSINLVALVALVQAGLPEFDIPADLLPAEPTFS